MKLLLCTTLHVKIKCVTALTGYKCFKETNIINNISAALLKHVL